MITPVNKEKCCGCMACKDVCAHKAISSVKDELGHIYPHIDTAKCVKCNLCSDVCAFRDNSESAHNIKKAYAFQLNDKKALLESTSGGAFTAISDTVLKKGGVVVGCVIQDDLTVCHIITDNPEIRDRMRKSKYVQSNTENLFGEIKKVVRNGTTVLFVGAPCQCAQAVKFTDNNENLITCDFLCHGVPSHDFFLHHIKHLEKKYGKKAIGYSFRDKKYGWSHTEGIQLANGKWKYTKSVQSYRKFFYSNVTIRESCLNCVYRCSERHSDITIADFWGVKKITGLDFENGASLIMCSTEKGLGVIFDAESYGRCTEVPVEKIMVKFPSQKPKSEIDKKEFLDIYSKSGYDGLVARYTPSSLKKNIEFELKKIIRKIRK